MHSKIIVLKVSRFYPFAGELLYRPDGLNGQNRSTGVTDQGAKYVIYEANSRVRAEFQ